MNHHLNKSLVAALSEEIRCKQISEKRQGKVSLEIVEEVWVQAVCLLLRLPRPWFL